MAEQHSHAWCYRQIRKNDAQVTFNELYQELANAPTLDQQAEQWQKDLMWELSRPIPFWLQQQKYWTHAEIFNDPTLTFNEANRAIAYLRSYKNHGHRFYPR